jgi:DNA-binding transcriptional MerR regulator
MSCVHTSRDRITSFAQSRRSENFSNHFKWNIPVQRKVQSKNADHRRRSVISSLKIDPQEGGVVMAVQYRIGEFADLSGVSPKTLRFYDEIGLLRPAIIDPRTRYRMYVPEQLQELAAILALKEVGVSLAEVRKLTGKNRSSKDRRQVLSELKERIQQSIESATQTLSWIDAALNELHDSEHLIPVVVKRRQPVFIASIRSTVESYAQIERFEQELLKAVPLNAAGDLRGVLWHRCAESGSPEGEPFIALKERIPARSGYELKQLPAATLACAYSEDDEMSAEHAYAAIRKWMNARGYRLAGPKREIYVDRFLEIQFPLSSA